MSDSHAVEMSDEKSNGALDSFPSLLSSGRSITSGSLVIKNRTLPSTQSREEMKKRGHQLDDGFFESFTLELTEAQVKRREEREATISAKEEEDNEGDVGALFVPAWAEADSAEVQSMKEKELEDAYMGLLRAVQSWLGAEGAHLKKLQTESYDYIKKVFAVDEEQHSTWVEQLKESTKPPKQFLRVSVVEGRDLPAKDANGLSDPYCSLGLVKFDPATLDGKSKTNHLHNMVPEGTKLFSTEVIEKNLNPTWNQDFDLEIDDLTTDCLQVDIWDSDTEKTVGDALKNISHVQGFAGLGRYFRQVAQTAFHGTKDDLMGRVYIPVKEIPSEGLEDWRHIMNKKQKQKKGQLHFKIQFVSERKILGRAMSWEDPFTEHWKIKRQFVRHEANLFKERGKKLWHGQLMTVTLDLLCQHALQNGVTSLHQAAIDWLINNEYNEKVGVDSQHLLHSLYDLDKEWENSDDPDEELQADKIKKVVSALDSYQSWCDAVLSKLRDIFPASSHQRLKLLLQCYHKTFDLAITRRHCPLKHFKESVFSNLVNSTKNWFERQQALSEPQITSDINETEALFNLVNTCFDDLAVAKKIYAECFQDVGIDYPVLTFQHLDSLISPCVETRMGAINESLKVLDIASAEFSRLATIAFRLYLAIKEFFRFEDSFPPEILKGIRLFQMHKWFKPVVLRWLELADQKAKRRIDRALELDHVAVTALSETIRHSSSAVDTVNLLFQMRVSWEQLGWPDPVAAYSFVVRLTEYICGCAMYYANKVHTILKEKGYYDDEGEFDVTEQLCVTFNDIDYVRRALEPLPESLAWEDIICALENENGAESAAHSKKTLYTFLHSADEDIQNSIGVIIEKVSEKMGIDVANHASLLIKFPKSAPFEKCITGLMQYLQKNLQSLGDWLLTDIFAQMLQPIYNVCISALLKQLQEKRDLAPEIYERILRTLETLLYFFRADGGGLRDESLKTESYKSLFDLAEMRQAGSPGLICRYLKDTNDSQAKAQLENRGYLTVLVGYIEPTQKLCIKVLSARNIPALDPNGLSDPYVKFQPYPASAFPRHASPQQTKVQKETLTAIYDETFYIPTSSDVLKKSHPVLVFHVFDWDRITKDDLAGEAILPLFSSVPHVSSEADLDRLEQTTMPLWLPPEVPSGEIFRIIESRTGDKEAMEFAKLRKKLGKMER
eukprot:m.162435 g.162435  ORF g.162435 m.162435 type:complete len:1179 (+) comp38842_c1_seq6:139-3675(+)